MKERTGSAKIFLDPDPAGEYSKAVKKLICSTLLPINNVRHGITVLNMFNSCLRMGKTGPIKIFLVFHCN